MNEQAYWRVSRVPGEPIKVTVAWSLMPDPGDEGAIPKE